jgi:hypothetical protein
MKKVPADSGTAAGASVPELRAWLYNTATPWPRSQLRRIDGRD